MTSDLLLKLLQINVALTAATLIVLILRKAALRLFGARIVYCLWLLVPLAGLFALLPPRPVEGLPAPPLSPVAVTGAVEQVFETFAAPQADVPAAGLPLDPWIMVGAVWLTGFILMAGVFAFRQARFMADAGKGEAGPAVVGFLRPRIITPSDFESRFTPREQTVVLAHERVHLARNDARLNALVALARCLCWFNPLVHLAAHMMRIDQELACDAAVVARHPKARAPYAQALLKAQLAARPLPLGCYWPAGTEHPLTERIAMLKMSTPSALRGFIGACAITSLSLGVGYAAWAAAPVVTPVVVTPIETFADAFLEAPSPAPHTVEAPIFVPEEPQSSPPPTTETPRLPNTFANNFDAMDSLTLTGRVVSVDYSGSSTVVSVVGEAIGRAGQTGSDNSIWRVETQSAQFITPESRNALHLGDQIKVRGYNALDKSCQPSCRMTGRTMEYAATGAPVFSFIRNPNSIDSRNCADLLPEATETTRRNCANLMAQLNGSAPPAPAQAPAIPAIPAIITNSVARQPFAFQPTGRPQFETDATLKSIDWTIPRVTLHVVEKSTGRAWVLEGGTTNTLLRSGISRSDTVSGTALTLRIGPTGDLAHCKGECEGIARMIQFPDGRKVFRGSSGTGLDAAAPKPAA